MREHEIEWQCYFCKESVYAPPNAGRELPTFSLSSDLHAGGGDLPKYCNECNGHGGWTPAE